MSDKGSAKASMSERIAGLCAAAVALALLPACFAYQRDVDTLRADVNTLKWESFEAGKSMVELKSSVSQVSRQIEDITTRTGPVNEQTLLAIRESQTSLNIKVDALSREVQALTGRYEEDKFNIDNAVAGYADELAIIKDRLAKLDAEIAALPAHAAQPGGGGDAAVKKPDNPEALYASAYDLYKEKKYKESRAGFEDFLKKYPGHDLASNAQFWTAENYYAEGDFESSVLAYEAVLKKYTSSPKAAPALLKQAFAFIELGDDRAAAGILKELIEKHPGSPQADAAKAKLKQIEKK